jgi:hypothetical protein
MTLTAPVGANFAIYVSTGGLQMIELDPAITVSGTAYSQQAIQFSNSSIQGLYALNLTGATGNGESDFIGAVNADGAGAFTGSLDVNEAGSIIPGLALTGTYTSSPNGRATGTLSSSNGVMTMGFYTVSTSRVLALELDSGRVAVGEFNHQ